MTFWRLPTRFMGDIIVVISVTIAILCFGPLNFHDCLGVVTEKTNRQKKRIGRTTQKEENNNKTKDKRHRRTKEEAKQANETEEPKQQNTLIKARPRQQEQFERRKGKEEK